MTKEYDVVIAGGGPVGMGLAIDLAMRGVDVCIVERRSRLHEIPKGQNLTQRTMEHLAFWGCEAAVRAARLVPPDYAIGGLTSYRTLLSPYHYDWLQRERVRPYYYTDNERLPQYRTEEVLRDRAAQFPNIDICYGWTVTDYAEQADCIEVAGRRTGEDETRSWATKYLIGCDGAHSTIRECACISQTKSDHDRLMVLLVFRSTGLHELLKRYPGKQFYCVLHPDLEGYWLFFGRVDLGTTWFFHAPVPPDTTEENFDFKAYLQRAVGEAFDVNLDYVGFWDLRFAVADAYRKGSVFVAGDAAHSHPPYGGYGVNLGFEDARNLGWKLAARLQGWSGDFLLDSYEAERRPVFESTARDFIQRFIREDGDFLRQFDVDSDRAAFEAAWRSRYEADFEVSSFEPNYDGSSIVFGDTAARPSAIGSHEFVAKAGHHLAPANLADGRQSFEAYGNDFTLFALAASGAETRDFVAAARQLRIPLKVIEEPNSPARKIWEADHVLVRPDNFVAWTSETDNPDPLAILKRAAGYEKR